MGLIIGKDKCRRPIILARVNYLDPNKTTEKRVQNFVFYTVEELMKQMPKDVGRFCAIVDFKGGNFFNVRITQAFEMVPILQDCYTETMHKAYVVNAPLLLWILWILITPVLEVKTLERVGVLSKVYRFSL
jgi:hypothetical protein